MQFDLALLRPGRGPSPPRFSDGTAPLQSSIGREDLVTLAREILEGAVETKKVLKNLSDFEMASEEDSIVVQTESPTSRFTAVNGKEPSGGESPTNGVNGNGSGNGNGNGSRRGSDERSNGQPRITPPGQEKLTITTTQREDWIPPANGERNPYQTATPYTADTETSHKRKRSVSLDQNSSSANSYHQHGLPSSTKETPTTATTESDGAREENLRPVSQSDPRESYGSDAHYRHFIGDDHHDSRNQDDPWPPRPYSQQGQITSDEHLSEVLQRASQGLEAQHHDYERTSPGDDDRSNPYGGYGHDRREMSVQSDPKKRKRNFSNRTKTGCMTCRRRKKKCDENKPECKLLEDASILMTLRLNLHRNR